MEPSTRSTLPQKFLEIVVSQLVEEIKPAVALKKLTSNSELLGAYAEAAVRRLVARVVAPLQVCRGTVIDEALYADREELPELDTIIWAPCPVPAIFAIGDFGLVPRSSSFGFLEIKRSLYPGVFKEIQKKTQKKFSKKYVSDQSRFLKRGALGVVCVKLGTQNLKGIQDLLDSGRAVVLFEEQNDDLKPRAKDIAVLVNRLTEFRFAASQVLGKLYLNENLLKSDKA